MVQALHAALAVDPLASAPRDATGLIAFIDRHRLAGLAAKALQGTPADDGFSSALRARQRRAALCAMRHAAAALHLIRTLNARRIEAIPLKGALLADHLFGDPSLRDIRDADLLIRPRDLAQADQIMLDSGYQRVSPIRLPRPHSHTHRRLMEHGYHLEYTQQTERVKVELHWRFPHWSSAAVETIWQSTESRIWRGTPVRMLANDSLLLLLLCDHGARHRWFLLKWLVDAATLLPRVGDTDGLLQLARRLDVERPLGQAVVLCNRIFGTPVAAGLRILSETPECRWLAAQALESIQAPAKDYFASGRSLRGKLRQKFYERRLRTQPWPWRYSMPVPDLTRPLLWLQRRLLA